MKGRASRSEYKGNSLLPGKRGCSASLPCVDDDPFRLLEGGRGDVRKAVRQIEVEDIPGIPPVNLVEITRADGDGALWDMKLCEKIRVVRAENIVCHRDSSLRKGDGRVPVISGRIDQGLICLREKEGAFRQKGRVFPSSTKRAESFGR